MRKSIRKFVALVADSLPICEPIYEFGSLQVQGQEGFADLRTLFPGKEYVGADMRPGPGVQKVLNLHDIDLPDDVAGTVLCVDTLEHVEHPQRAAEEVHRILKPGGIAVFSSVMFFPIHSHPWDYWRFTPEGFRSILQPFSSCFVGSAGRDRFPDTVVGIGFKQCEPPMDRFLSAYEQWRKHYLHMPEHLVKNLTPPALLPFVSRLHRLAATCTNGTRRAFFP